MSAGRCVAHRERPREGGPDRKEVEVAVGVLIRARWRFLLTSRPPGKVYDGYWEFPGGKLEPGETVEQALRRELREEIGVTIGAVHPWRSELVDYPHALVRLNFCKVFEWTGELHMHEGPGRSPGRPCRCGRSPCCPAPCPCCNGSRRSADSTALHISIAVGAG